MWRFESPLLNVCLRRRALLWHAGSLVNISNVTKLKIEKLEMVSLPAYSGELELPPFDLSFIGQMAVRPGE